MENVARQQEVDANLEFFLKKEPTLKNKHSGKYALLRNKEIIEFYDTIIDAHATGTRFFEDGLFSIQKVDDKPMNLGIFSYT